MVSQIDEKLEELLSKEKLSDSDIENLIGAIPSDTKEYIAILKKLKQHIRTYGRRTDCLDDYIRKIKENL